MREIKFRAWDKKVNTWLCGYNYCIEIATGHFLFVRGGDYFEWIGEMSNVELCQFTGLKDKTGKEIYEGDILKVVDPNGDDCPNIKVEYDDNATAYVIEIDPYDFHLTSLGWAKQMGYEFEIIGNIYENPDKI